MSKHLHRIIINKEKKYTKKYIYNFGNTKDICIKLAKDYISIEVELTKIYGNDSVLSNNNHLFADAIKKALLLYLINYSENINIKYMNIYVDNESDSFLDNIDGCVLPISSLIVGKLYTPFINKFNNNEIKGILSQTKSSSDSRLASLMALIISKSKSYEAERFIYLWMAFNGMYGYFSKLIDETQGERIGSDFKQIMAMQVLLGIGCDRIKERTEKKRIPNEIISIIRHYDNISITRESLENGKDKDLANKILDKLFNINSKKKYNLSAYGYLLTQFSYYFRCKYIHASKPMSLFSYNEDVELKCLKIINNLLEKFIEDNLHKWFDDEYVKILYDKASKIDVSLLK